MSRNLAESGTAREVWWKSSYSGDTGGNCVEVAAAWRKSSYSGDTGGHCVEVAGLVEHMGMRDSTQPDAARLYVARKEWAAFLTAVRDGQL